MTPTISDETLLAYVDGELDAAGRTEVEAALRSDPQLADKVEQQRALRNMLSAAYDPVLAEPVPARLLAAAQPKAVPAKVVDLAAARTGREAARAARAGWGWQQWGGMAACLVIGLFVGRDMLAPESRADVVVREGKLVAHGALDQLLTKSSAADADPAAPNRVGLSFVARSGEYCRTFTWGDRTESSAGLACRSGPAWELRTLARNTTGGEASGPMRMAASTLPPDVLRAVEAQIAGSPLDAQAERAALAAGWRKP